jgi:branched-chain amino acid transport system substrate-binding protein
MKIQKQTLIFRSAVVVILILLVTMAAACALAPTPTPAPAPKPAPTPTPSQIATPIKIGLLVPLTGPAGQGGQFMVDGTKFAFEEANYEVAGRKIELIVEDDATKAEVSIDKARKLIENDKVDLIIGPLVSACVEATAPYVSKMGIPQLLLSPNALKIGQYDWCFMASGSTRQMVYPMGIYIYDKLGYKTATAMAEDSVSGHGFLDPFLEAFKNKGGKVIQEQYPPMGSPDFASYLANLKDSDTCIAWFQAGDAPRFLSAYLEFGIGKRMPLQPAYFGNFVQTYMLNRFPPAVGDSLVGKHVLSLYSYLVDTPAGKKFDAAWQKRFGNHPADDAHATPYVISQVALEALKATGGNTTPANLKQAILAVDFESCEGHISFDSSTKCAIRDTYISRIDRDGKNLVYVPVETIKNIPPGGIK